MDADANPDTVTEIIAAPSGPMLDRPVVLAIGASAVGTGSLLRVLADLPLGDALAVVLALQHREALDEAGFRDALAARADALRVVEDGVSLQGGLIYLPPPGVIVTLHDSVFRTAMADGRPGERGTIDSLLVSLAADQDGHAVGLVLLGVGGDGTLGIAALKETSGLTLAEAAGNDLDAPAPSNSAAALADAVLPVEAIPDRLASHLRYIAGHPSSGSGSEAEADSQAALSQIVTVLRDRTGHDFHGYKRNTFLRRVQRRMQVTEADGIRSYLAKLRADRDEPQLLFNDLLIGVTQFFRDPREFEQLEQRIIPDLFAGKGRSSQIRVWVLGCSTGEEAYSLGILLREHASRLDAPPHIQIFASDIDGRALAVARVGRYPLSIAEHVSPERLASWFVKEGNTYCVARELRETCVFSQHSIVRDAPFSRLDLISCRNLLIYLDMELQSQVIPLFHFALQPNGVLFLGSSENVSRHTKLFAPVDRGHRIYRRLETGTRVAHDFPFTGPDRRPDRFASTARPPVVQHRMARRAEQVAERYTPAYAIVDEQFDVLHFSASAGRFIHPARGAATLGLLGLVHADLRTDLQGALKRALRDNTTVEVHCGPMNGSGPGTDIVVDPVQEEERRTFIVLFKDGPRPPDPTFRDPANSSDERMQTLEAELAVTRERLHSMVEELESTNEELKASNEEYQSLNEELQSANEELETSKEELQSMNEELTTVNGELAHRVHELGRANSDIKNLMESTQIATLFLDAGLRVMNFTPALSEIFHLVETDIGRPIEHIKPRLRYEALPDDVRKVIRTLGTVDRQLEGPEQGSRYMVRVLPYRSVDNVIAGAVVTFTDMTPQTRAEAALRDSEERFRLIVETARDYAIFLTDADGHVTDWLPGAANVFGWSTAEMTGQSLARLYLPEARAAGMPGQDLESARRDGSAPSVGWHSRKDGGQVFIEGMLTTLHAADGLLRGFVMIGQDVTERRAADQALEDSRRQLRSLVEGIPQLVWRAADGGHWTWCSPQWTAVTGLSEEQSLGQGWLAALHPDDRPLVEAAWAELGGEAALDIEMRVFDKQGGRYRWFSTRAVPVRIMDGTPVEWLGTSTNIDDLRRLQDAQQVMVAELQHRTRNLVAIVRHISDRTVATSKTLAEYRDQFHDRLTALARVQGLLSRAKQKWVTFDELLRAELDAYVGRGTTEGQARVVLDGPDGIGLRSATVQTFALALHELTTNAVKYGALAAAGGQLSVRWSVDAPDGVDERLRVDWHETGVDLPADGGVVRFGYGRELIERALPYQLGAETQYVLGPDGVRCTIVVPLRPETDVGAGTDG